MVYFSKETLKFLKQLEKNNNRDWFNKNKQRYLDSVKDPFETFIGDLIEAMTPHFDSLPITPKDAIFRIYRDVRFSKDKSPYKTKISAIVSPGGTKNKTIPGIYLEISASEMRIYSGLYMLDSKQLYNVRSHISHNLEEFESLISDDKFVNSFAEILTRISLFKLDENPTTYSSSSFFEIVVFAKESTLFATSDAIIASICSSSARSNKVP